MRTGLSPATMLTSNSWGTCSKPRTIVMCALPGGSSTWKDPAWWKMWSPARLMREYSSAGV